jgi:Domain of unknown function DUF29
MMVHMSEAKQSPGRELYERDEHEWIAAQISALASGQMSRLDRENLIEFLSEMTIRDRRELRSRLTVLLLHLLKVRFQPDRLSVSWVSTILVQQNEIRSLIEDIPSLGARADAIAGQAYRDALRLAVRETGLPAAEFPASMPWTVVEALAYEPPALVTKN